MAEYLSPGVYVEEFDSGPAPMQGVSTSTAGFVGLAEKGPVSGAPVFVTGISDFHRKFGGYLQKSEFGEYRYLAHAVSHFFANGGARAFVMRVAPSDAAVAGLSCGEGLRFEAKNPGAWGNRIVITMVPASKGKSQIMEDLGEGKYTLKSVEEFYAGDVVALEGPDGVEYGVVAQVEGKNITMASPFQSAQVVDQALLPQVTIKTCEMNMEIRCEDMAETYENVSFNITTPYFIEKMLSKSELVNVTAQAVEEANAPIELVKEWTGCQKAEVRLQRPLCPTAISSARTRAPASVPASRLSWTTAMCPSWPCPASPLPMCSCPWWPIAKTWAAVSPCWICPKRPRAWMRS